MFYAIRHLTRYRYNRPVWQSMMEVRMHPISEATQRCFTFRLQVNPRARIFTFQDHLGCAQMPLDRRGWDRFVPGDGAGGEFLHAARARADARESGS